MNPDQNTLIGVDGRPCFGIYNEPMAAFNLNDFRPYGTRNTASFLKTWILKYRIKQWEYLGLCHADMILGIAIVNLGYMCNFFAYVYDRSSARISEYNIISPGGKAAVFQESSLAGGVFFAHGKTAVQITHGPETIAVKGAIQEEFFIELYFQKSATPLVCLTRTGLKGFNYTHKEAGVFVQGTVRQKGKSWDVHQEQSFGVRDYTLGFLARQTFWNWASGGGMDKEGRRIGFNLVQGVNETGFTENAFWINDRVVKTDVVNFRYDDLDILSPWFIESNDGRVRLRFLPEGSRSADTHAGLIVSRFHQPFGRFEGRLQDGAQIYELENVSGFTEEHFAKW